MKQETLEEVAYKIFSTMPSEISTSTAKYKALELVKWQQEQDKNKYSKEEVLEFTQTMIMQYKFGNTNIEQMDLLKETLQQFKNK
jgi:hypothetical protein